MRLPAWWAARAEWRRRGRSSTAPHRPSTVRHPTLEGEQALRALLDEHDDEHEHRNLGEHRARPGLEKFVDNAKAHRCIHGAGELAHTAQHDHHERIDDIALPEVGADIADLRQRATREPGDARA